MEESESNDSIVFTEADYGSLTPYSFSSNTYGTYHAFPKKITYEKLQNDLSRIDAYVRHPNTKIGKRNQQFLLYPRQRIEADLIILKDDLFPKENQSTCILTIIDCFSNFADGILIANKSGKTVKNAFEILWNRFGGTNYTKITIATDRGTEFLNRYMKLFFRKHKINHKLVDVLTHAPKIERFNGILQKLIYKYISHTQSSRWKEVLPYLIRIYNEKPCSAFDYRLSPSQVDAEPSNWIRARYYKERRLMRFFNKYGQKKKLKLLPPKFKIGDIVRIIQDSGPFKKSYRSPVTEEKFIINNIIKKSFLRTLYEIKDYSNNILEGYFYDFELILDKSGYFRIAKVHNFRKYRGRDQALVSWIGYSEKTWIDRNQIKHYPST